MTTETLEQAADRIAKNCCACDCNPGCMCAQIKAALLEYGNLVGAEIERLRKDAGRYEKLKAAMEESPQALQYFLKFHNWHPDTFESGSIDETLDLMDAAQVKEKA